MRWKIALILVVLVAALYLYKTSQIKNAFDEMYYDKVPSLFGGYSPASFKGTRILEAIDDIARYMSKDFISEFYNSGYLRDDEDLYLYFYRNKEVLLLSFNKMIDSKTSIQVNYEYVVNRKELKQLLIKIYTENPNGDDIIIERPYEVTKFLKKHGITKRTIEEYRHYMLYETLLANWFKENKGKSKFDLNNIGELTIVKQ
ncbi:TipC family immunity protein [Numidum massiliense]|uniref:TipC family immunity protein n=1 Tax=Numidum massiliense TaxID=1522315 RepID=UPI0021C40F12|nr:TipC family immunity protein [Numidum massiliense]